MLRKMTLLLFAILLGYATAGFAGDYVLDASTMGVGATAGENLVVKEGCLDPSQSSCMEKVKWASAPITKIGNLDVIGSLSGNFEISVTADFNAGSKGIVLLTQDNKGIEFTITWQFEGGSEYLNDSGFYPNGLGEGGGGESRAPGWNSGYEFNNFTINVQQGVAKAHINGQQNGQSITLGDGVIFSRVLFKGITPSDRVSEVKIRGISGLAACNSTPTTPSTPTSSGDCTADYTATGSLHVPCVRVPGAFGKTELYDVWMQQKFPSFSFELDMNRVTVK